MIARTRKSLAAAPTPMAGLALGIASLGWCWENAGHFDGRMQLLGAAIAAVLLVILTLLAPAPVSESSQAVDAIFKEYDALPAEKK